MARRESGSVGRGERKPVLSKSVLRGIKALGSSPGVAEHIIGAFGEDEYPVDRKELKDARRAIEFANEMIAFRAKGRSR